MNYKALVKLEDMEAWGVALRPGSMCPSSKQTISGAFVLFLLQCSWCFPCTHLQTSPCLTFLLFPRDKCLTQRLLISLVVHNSLSLCPVNEDSDVIELPPPLILSLLLSPSFVCCVLLALSL